MFIPFGNIVDISLPNRVHNKSSTTYADIQFEEFEDCHEAIRNMNGYEYYSKFLICSEGQNKLLASTSTQAYNRAVWAQEEGQESDEESK